MNEIEMGVRIPVVNSDDIVDTLDNLVKEDVIVDYEISGDVGNFPEITIEFTDYSVLAHLEQYGFANRTSEGIRDTGKHDEFTRS